MNGDDVREELIIAEDMRHRTVTELVELREDVKAGMAWVVIGLLLSLLISLWSATLRPDVAIQMAPVAAAAQALCSLAVLGGASWIWWKM